MVCYQESHRRRRGADEGGEVMGACGCGDFQGDFKFKGPGNDYYILQVYPPCAYCETPAGVIIYRMGKTDQTMWRVDEIPEVKILDIGTAIWVLDAEKFKRNDIFEDMDTDVDHALIDAVNCAIKANRKNLLKR